MRTALLSALLISPFLAHAQDGKFESEVREAAGRLQSGIAGAKAASDKKEPAAAAAAASCAPETAAEPKLYSSDVRWGLSLPEMMALYEKLYASDKRLKKRAYRNEAKGRFELPLESQFGGPVAVPDILIKALVRHISEAFEKDYVDAVFFPDMGHSHLLIPLALYESKYDKYPTERRSQFYTAVFAGPIAADAQLTVYQNPDSTANTVGDVPGFRWWGAGFNFSAPTD